MKQKMQNAECRMQRVQHRTALHLVTVLLLLLSLQTLLADTNLDAVSDEIPPFRPAKGELPPTFWEQNGLWVALGAIVVLIVTAAVWRFLANRPPPAPPTPAEVARKALAALRAGGSSELPARPTRRGIAHTPSTMQLSSTPELADQLSRILRTYFVAVLHLSIPQLTNRELAGTLLSHPKMGTELASKAGTLLENLDRYRFDPQPNTTLPDAVEQAVRLVDLTEAALSPPPTTAPDGGNTDA